MSNKVVVTGGAGFIGSNLVDELVQRGEYVAVIDNLLTGKAENISEDIDFMKGDILDLHLLKKTFKDTEVVFHQAALPSVSKSVKDPLTTNQINITGTLNVLVAARDSGVKRVVYASSSSVYGDTPTLPKKEDMKPIPPSPYAITKAVGEYYCRIFYDIYGLETISLRYFNIFGPRQDPNSQYAAAIPNFITSMLNSEPPTIFGDGKQTRDFTFVKNVVEANLLAAKSKAGVGEVFNIGCGKRITVNELVEKTNEALGCNIKPSYVDPRPGDIRHSLADISKAEKLLGYNPRYSLEDGLRATIDWFRGI